METVMDHSLRLCQACQQTPRQAHKNSRYCLPCAQGRRRAPCHTLTPAQGAEVERLAGTITRGAIAQQVGVPLSQVSRYLREAGLRSNARDYPPDVVQAVCVAYEVLGRVKTQELFPTVRVRSIIERYKQYAPRQRRWTPEELLEAAQMAGIVSHTAQARYFGRPNASTGSIASVWSKHFRCAPRDVHGLGAHLVWQLCTPGVTATLVAQQTMPGPRTVVLWLDLATHLRADVEPEICEAIAALADFQGWLYGTRESADIRTMITEREAQYGRTSSLPQWDSEHAGSAVGAS